MNPGAIDVIALVHGPWRLGLAPELGGAIAFCRWRHPSGNDVDLLRPISRVALEARIVEGAACFPLTPYSNRIRDGRFFFAGHEIRLPRNTPGRHAEHGHGWRRPWSIEAMGTAHATLMLAHDPARDANATWPFAYEMRQRFILRDDGLEIELETRNKDDHAMPYGFGLHPYFPRTDHCTLRADVAGFWETDSEVMPTRRVPVPPHADLNAGVAIRNIELDNAFDGWRGWAEIVWPEWRTRLSVAAEPPLCFLVVYVPKGEGYFCAEPVSNATDAFNLAASGRQDVGMMALGPGERVAARIFLRAEAMVA